jgi:hypothetical protein
MSNVPINYYHTTNFQRIEEPPLRSLQQFSNSLPNEQWKEKLMEELRKPFVLKHRPLLVFPVEIIKENNKLP